MGLDFLEKAILKAGTLDNSVRKDVLANEKFDTVLGPAWFENQLLAEEGYFGQIGQWLNGKAEVIDVGPKRTAQPVYPKPPWPAAKPK